MDYFFYILIGLNMIVAMLIFVAYTLYGDWMLFIKAKLTKKDMIMVISRTNRILLKLTNFRFDFEYHNKLPWSLLDRADRVYRLGDRRVSVIYDGSGSLMAGAEPFIARKIADLGEKNITSYDKLVNLSEVDEDVKKIFFTDISLRDVCSEIADVDGAEIGPYIDIKVGRMREKLMKELGG